MPFRDIVGQPQAVNRLQKSLRNNRIAHAYLFSGAQGIGKGSCAVSLAQALNCDRGGEDGCGECPVCQKIMRFRSIDFRRIEPKGAADVITIDDIRELRREIKLAPVEGKYKVFYIKDADRMNEQSGNALLKVLEEPPEESVLILSTTRLHLLLPTVLSRCQVIHFRRLSREEVMKLLPPGDRAKFIAGLSEGSLGKALNLMKDGFEERERVITWLKENAGAEVEEIISLAEEVAGKAGGSGQKKKKLLIFLEIILSWYRDMLNIVVGAEQLFNEDCAQELKERAFCLSDVQLVAALKIILQAQEWIELNANPRLVLEVMLLKLRRV